MDNHPLSELILRAFGQLGWTLTIDSWLYVLSAVGLMLAVLYLLFKTTDILLQKLMVRIVKRSNNQWDDELLTQGFFHRCAHLVPAIALYLMPSLLFAPEASALRITQQLSTLYLTVAVVSAGLALFNALESIYNQSKLIKRAPITGFVQIGKLILIVVGILLVIANLLGKSPLLLLSGLGAMTAVLLLVFRDTILGFVAGIQIAANKMVNHGDWIEMPQYGVDGNVMAVGLTTVKVRNWDNTISTLPTYSLITDPVKNWHGMETSGGRRIKRALHIDQQSVRFLTEQDIQHLSSFKLLKDYLGHKRHELAECQQGETDLGQRKLTNIGTFRAYIEQYLKHHPQVNQDLTLLVRQLAPTELGLPIEVYCFSKNKAWVAYEGIQADIFDHLLASMPLFGLRPYQRISDSAASEITSPAL